jgi:hypothetical protein
MHVKYYEEQNIETWLICRSHRVAIPKKINKPFRLRPTQNPHTEGLMKLSLPRKRPPGLGLSEAPSVIILTSELIGFLKVPYS